MARLTEKQARFVEEYLVDLNATQAAIRAGYSEKTARSVGCENLTKPDIQEAIKSAMSLRSERTEITQDMVLRELAAIGFSRITDYVNIKNGVVELNDTSSLTDSQNASIASIKEGKFGIELKNYDKLRALELLGQHLGMFHGKSDSDENVPDDGFVDALRGEAAEVWQED